MKETRGGHNRASRLSDYQKKRFIQGIGFKKSRRIELVELGKSLNISRPQVFNLITKMVAANVIKQTADLKDMRSVYYQRLHITEIRGVVV